MDNGYIRELEALIIQLAKLKLTHLQVQKRKGRKEEVSKTLHEINGPTEISDYAHDRLSDVAKVELSRMKRRMRANRREQAGTAKMVRVANSA